MVQEEPFCNTGPNTDEMFLIPLDDEKSPLWPRAHINTLLTGADNMEAMGRSEGGRGRPGVCNRSLNNQNQLFLGLTDVKYMSDVTLHSSAFSSTLRGQTTALRRIPRINTPLPKEWQPDKRGLCGQLQVKSTLTYDSAIIC
ncbi:unnamed protein product [Pleuronectes platessa]|uniref:Uncharacterized protein n=1 Tax=Pleuronectes platessa TaxID=8262 RepID=A0A9N7VEW7_PLEPL|nr:unnamed protein product [Pleuronectes platessa]